MREPEGLRDQEAGKDLHVLGMCYSERTVGGKTSTELCYFIGSKKAGAHYDGRALRNHGQIENCLRGQMDVSFREDENRTQQRNAAQNLALQRRITVTLLRRHPSKDSIASKRAGTPIFSKKSSADQ
jgi:hypothetical protein